MRDPGSRACRCEARGHGRQSRACRCRASVHGVWPRARRCLTSVHGIRPRARRCLTCGHGIWPRAQRCLTCGHGIRSRAQRSRMSGRVSEARARRSGGAKYRSPIAAGRSLTGVSAIRSRATAGHRALLAARGARRPACVPENRRRDARLQIDGRKFCCERTREPMPGRNARRSTPRREVGHRHAPGQAPCTEV